MLSSKKGDFAAGVYHGDAVSNVCIFEPALELLPFFLLSGSNLPLLTHFPV
jgi:hypothetical protein